MNFRKILLATTATAMMSSVAMAADDGLVVFDWSGYEDEGSRSTLASAKG